MGRKSSARTGGTGSVPLFHATTEYKQWARQRMKAAGLTLEALAQAIKRLDGTLPATSGGLSQFFGKENEIPEPSNTALMPALNQILGAAPPPVCRPDDEYAQLVDALRARLETMTPGERDLVRLHFGLPPRAK